MASYVQEGYIPKLDIVSLGDYCVLVAVWSLFVMTCYLIHLLRSNWLQKSKVTICMTIFTVASVFLQVFNSMQFFYDFPLVVNDVFNLAIYAYMALVVLLG
jgi:hypothetical protein